MDGIDVLRICRRVDEPLFFIPNNYNLYEDEDRVYLLHKIKLVTSFKANDEKVRWKIMKAINRHEKHRCF